MSKIKYLLCFFNFQLNFEISNFSQTFWWSSSELADLYLKSWMVFLFGSDEGISTVDMHFNVVEKEREFHDAVREHIICLLLFIFLYLFSYWIISQFKMRTDHDSLFSGDEDYFVYRISIWMCTVSMAVSVGSTVLMPFSVLSAELLERYGKDSYYLQWLSWSLIHALWNYVFVLGNLSLFIFLPFSYFFIESQGFSKKKNGIMGRVYETLAVCALMIVVLLCLCDLIYNLLVASSTNISILSLFSIFSITSVNLPLIYSCVSLFGVVLLLVSAPFGFAKMFTIVSEKAQVKVTIPDDDDQQIIERLEMSCQKRRLRMNNNLTNSPRKFSYSNGSPLPYLRTSPRKYYALQNNGYDIGIPHPAAGDYFRPSQSGSTYGGYVSEIIDGGESASALSLTRKIPLGEKSLRWYQRLLNLIKYPACILGLVFLTSVAVLMVVINTLKLAFGYKALPVYVQYMEVQSRHTFGLLGVILEMIVILYIMATSLVGFYSIPLIKAIRPQRSRTSMTAIIINCSTLAVLSSSLPVVAATLGITSFDLLGAYGSLQWLSNFRLVVAYNVMFAGVTVSILAQQLTSNLFKELARRILCRSASGIDDVANRAVDKLE